MWGFDDLCVWVMMYVVEVVVEMWVCVRVLGIDVDVVDDVVREVGEVVWKVGRRAAAAATGDARAGGKKLWTMLSGFVVMVIDVVKEEYWLVMMDLGDVVVE